MTYTFNQTRGHITTTGDTISYTEVAPGRYRMDETRNGRKVSNSDVQVVNGVFHWVLSPDNLRIILPETCAATGINKLPGYDLETQQKAYAADVAAFLKAYRAEQAKQPVTNEQRFEARAAFGPGVEVVNVLTGRKFRT